MPPPKKIESPELLALYFDNYRKFTKTKPFLQHDFVGKDAEEVRREKERPLTMEGFENYCFEQGIINDLGDYFSNKENRYEAFAAICRAIKRAIRQDQIEGGMAGIYNPSITQRLNGLTEKIQTENEHKITSMQVEVVNTGVPLAGSETEIK